MRCPRRAAARARRFPAVALAPFFVSFLACLATGCALPFTHQAARELEETRRLHDVEVHIALRSADETSARLAMSDAFAAAEAVGGMLLASHPASEIDVLCRVPSHLWLEISPVTWQALALASRIAAETEGAYDFTWPPLLRVWGLRGTGPPRVPRDFEIEMALARVDYSDVELAEEDGLQVRRLSRRTEIDLGGLARGAMLDAAVERLRALGVVAGRADTTHEHAVFGGTEREPWRVAIVLGSFELAELAEPLGATEENERPEPVGVVTLYEGGLAVASRGAAIATESGATIHDRFDPRSGRPARTHWAVVAAPRASESAAYADAFFSMGMEAGAFVATRSDLRAVIVAEPNDGDASEWLWKSPELALELTR
jgi:thiamine biosynthesis lipoprotein